MTTTDAGRRAKDYLTEQEVERLLQAAKDTRNPVRDQLLVLMMYRHGLRVSEACSMRRDSVDLDRSRVYVKRLKNGNDSEQPIGGDELRLVRRYLSARSDGLPWLFISERGQPLDRRTVYAFLRKVGIAAKVGQVWPHMLRHGCGYYLANKGVDTRTIQDYLGHRNIQHTAHYTRIAGSRFEGLWK